MDTLHKTISVVRPVDEAIEKTKILLFRPFNMEKWFVIGFCAWLATMAQGGFNFNFGGRHSGGEWTKVTEFIRTHILMVSLCATAAFLIIITIHLVLLWLNSRGKFMFLDCLAKNKAHVAEPWKTFKRQANSLFFFRLIMGVLSLVVTIIICIPIVLLAIVLKKSDSGPGMFIGVIIAGVILVLAVILFFSFIRAITIDFVLPVMYLQRITTLAAWSKIMQILKPHFWKIILYLIFKFLISICIATIVIVMAIIGCCFCCASAVLLIPYIGTVVLLPFICFFTLYTLCFLRQFGSEYDVFTAGV